MPMTGFVSFFESVHDGVVHPFDPFGGSQYVGAMPLWLFFERVHDGVVDPFILLLRSYFLAWVCMVRRARKKTIFRSSLLSERKEI
jgi:hypothetical protein